MRLFTLVRGGNLGIDSRALGVLGLGLRHLGLALSVRFESTPSCVYRMLFQLRPVFAASSGLNLNSV